MPQLQPPPTCLLPLHPEGKLLCGATCSAALPAVSRDDAAAKGPAHCLHFLALHALQATRLRLVQCASAEAGVPARQAGAVCMGTGKNRAPASYVAGTGPAAAHGRNAQLRSQVVLTIYGAGSCAPAILALLLLHCRKSRCQLRLQFRHLGHTGRAQCTPLSHALAGCSHMVLAGEPPAVGHRPRMGSDQRAATVQPAPGTAACLHRPVEPPRGAGA